MKTNRYRFKAAGKGPAELLIYGDIGEIWDAEESADAKTVVGKIQGLKDRPIDVRINSYGGSVSDGLAIFNALRRHGADVTTHIDGVAFSIASLIAMGGDRVEMADNALMMIHAPWGMSIGNAVEMREMADALDSFAEAMTSAYIRDGGPEREQIAAWLTDGKDHYFTADEARGLGLVDDLTEGIDIAAALRGAQRYTPPAGTTASNQQETPIMAEEHTPGGQTENTPADLMKAHKAAVQAGLKKGALAENKRQQTVRALFYADDGSFAFGDESDGTDPMLALMNQCLGDTGCDELEATRRINAALRNGLAPIGNPLASAQPRDGSSYAHSARHPGTGRTGGFGDLRMGQDAGDKFRDGAVKALMIRAGLERDPKVRQQERDNEFLSMSIADLCRHQLAMAGLKTGGSREDIIRRTILASGPGQGTDHFPAIMENIAEKSVMDGFMSAEETWDQWTIPGTLNDYRDASRVNKSLFDKLDKMEEFESFQHGRFADVKQAITGYLHGKSFSLTLQAMVNDDLGILTEDARSWGEAANVTIGDAVFTVLTASGTGGYGQVMTEDSTVLFHADHSNYVATGSGAAPSVSTIAAGRTAMMTQTGPNDRIVATRPRYILHGTSLTPTVWVLVNSMNQITGEDATVPERNWVQSAGLQSVEEYRFDSFVSTAWIMAALRRTVEVAFVGGQSTPRVDRMPSGEIPGVTWQISIPFGVAALDYRTFYFNYGA